MAKNKDVKLVDRYCEFIKNAGTLGEYIEALIAMPPRGDGARDAVEEEVSELCVEMRKGLQSIESMLKNKIWEEEDERNY